MIFTSKHPAVSQVWRMVPDGYGPPTEVVVKVGDLSPKLIFKTPVAFAITRPNEVIKSKWSERVAPVERYAGIETSVNGGSNDGLGIGSALVIAYLAIERSVVGFVGGVITVTVLSMQYG